MIKDFINISDFTTDQLRGLLARAIEEKALYRSGKLAPSLKGKALAMIFEKPSLRTRVSFETAMTHLGGHGLYLAPADIGLGSREPVKDIARVLGGMCDGIMARTFSHAYVQELAEYASVPVINALTDYSHPCQAMADVMTAQEHFGSIDGKTMTFVGDGNNVARSLAVLCGKLGMRFILAAPQGYELDDESIAALPEGTFTAEANPAAAVAEADIIYTDTWVSMGQEEEKAKRLADFAGYQINADLMAKAPASAIVLHCLPAYRDYEITDETFEAHAKTIFDEAENRLHFQRALVNVLMGDGGIA